MPLIERDSLFYGGKIFYRQEILELDLVVNKSGVIVDIGENLSAKYSHYQRYNCSKLLITPSFYDAHAHSRIPNHPEKEDLPHLIKACLNGGFLDVICMSNVIPRPVDTSIWNELQHLHANPSVNFYQAAAITVRDQNSCAMTLAAMQELSKKTFLFTDDGFSIDQSELMQQALQIAKAHDLILLLHEEDFHTVENGPVYQDEFTNKLKLNRFYGSNKESTMIARDLNLNQTIQARLHFQHLSTIKSIELIFDKLTSQPITCEVTPHHLTLSTADIELNNANYKMNPPLPTPADQAALINALNQNIIQIIATDHAPHTQQEKSQGLIDSANGIIGLSLAFPVLYTFLVLTKKVSLPIILTCLSINPAKLIFRQTHGIEIGSHAKFAIFDLNALCPLDSKYLGSKASNTPFKDKKLYGKIVFLLKKNLILLNSLPK